MTKGKINISEAELEVMKVIWSKNKPVTSLDIIEAFEYKGWKKTTIGTFLTRLVEKGALSAEKQGKLYYYTPLISQKEYRKSQTKNLILLKSRANLIYILRKDTFTKGTKDDFIAFLRSKGIKVK